MKKSKKFAVVFCMVVVVFICTQAWAVSLYAGSGLGNMNLTASVSEPVMLFLSGCSLIGLARLGRRLIT